MSCIKIDERYQLFWEEEEDHFHVQFVSLDKRVRAVEFMDYLFDSRAELVGKKNRAYGVIKKTFAKALVVEHRADNFDDFLQKKARSYFSECQWIFPKQYAIEEADNIRRMKKYVKKRIAWAFVKTTDIVGMGEQIYMTSLENESGLTLTASTEDYIMIGCRGEIYNIKSDKFRNTYDPSNEPFDIFEQMATYIPEVKIVSNSEYVCIDQKARLCYPKQDKFIYAKELNCRTKVFGEGNEDEYFLGKVGDYLAIRGDDPTDMYIIQGDIFQETYEERKE